METRQKLEAEAGALRVLLQEFLTLSASEAGLPIAERRLCCPEFGDKVRAALAVTDAGKEVADRISGYQEQLKMNTRLIELLRDQRTSLAAQNRHILEVISGGTTALDDLHAFASRTGKMPSIAVCVELTLEAIRGLAANFNAHKYADLLSMATTFTLSDRCYIEKRDEQWTVRTWPSGPYAADGQSFPTLEAAFAYIEDHPAILGLQNVENAAKKVLDTIQPSR